MCARKYQKLKRSSLINKGEVSSGTRILTSDTCRILHTTVMEPEGVSRGISKASFTDNKASNTGEDASRLKDFLNRVWLRRKLLLIGDTAQDMRDLLNRQAFDQKRLPTRPRSSTVYAMA